MAPVPSSTRQWLPYTAAVTAGLLVIAGTFVFVRQRDAGADRPRADCATRLDVNSSTEKAALLVELAERYNSGDRSLDGGGCAQVHVSALNSGQAAETLAAGWSGTGLPEPQVWLPTSSLWTGQLQLLDQAAGRPPQTPGQYPSIANSPLVIAMPQPKGELVRQKGPLGWGQILGLSGRTGWTAFGKPEWGRFTFGKDNPNLSTSGLAATIATYYAAANRSSDLTRSDLADPKVTQFVRRIEANVSHYSDDSVELLRDLAEADLAGGGASTGDMSAIVMQEELVHLYNEGGLSPRQEGQDRGSRPKVPLVAVHPKEGTFNLDHPFVVLPSADERQRAAADDFLKFLTEDAQQASFARLGFRDHKRGASAELLASVGTEPTGGLDYFAPPNPAVVKAMLGGWSTLRKKANILIALDTSGSMEAPIGDSTRFQVAAAAATKGLKLLNSEDRVGLWSFSSETKKRLKSPYQEEVRLGDFDQNRINSRIAGLHVAGETALYATIRAAHRQLLDRYDPDRINAVVVLTDGKNEYPRDNDLARLLADVTLDPDRPVKVFCIAFDGESDFATLDRIAKASSGKAFDARNPAMIDEAFVKLVSSF
ncbi:substrate-binding and VWA domain-containing protein [Micromonospora peucetia]|uniref:Ca-activated chloride channel family protein n=1 Tax=Micromonospora peucetia TaxID=47871 RepID=A0A1C6W002_9ACTN|nr:extracellular solute-binding protein [Micromonospora peucetia]MCX4390771.1 substrate-binding and VWA domain-containing protein [Micromonospora peucetia]SCL71777.1 Ca-activated chloride channel family protein [Micromonospora peucetia]